MLLCCYSYYHQDDEFFKNRSSPESVYRPAMAHRCNACVNTPAQHFFRIAGRQNKQICDDFFPDWDEQRAKAFADKKEAAWEILVPTGRLIQAALDGTDFSCGQALA